MSFFRTLSIVGVLVVGSLAATPSRAASLQAGDLIKTPSQTDVYYYGSNAKRYVFPNEKTFMSWYGDVPNAFTSVKEITPQEMAGIGIGGAVTYRPGKRMVKITTDPKVYAVAKGGVLRWVKTEQLASELYGPAWAKNIDDLPDAFFATYTMGEPIKISGDYSVNDQLSSAGTIFIDKQIPETTPPSDSIPPSSSTPSSTGMITIQVSKPSALRGDMEALTVNAAHPSGIQKIDIFFDGSLIKTCSSSQNCTTETQIPLSSVKTAYEAKTVATALDATTLSTTTSILIENSNSGLVTMRLGRAMIKPGQTAEVVVASNVSIDVVRTDISIDGQGIKTCTPASSVNAHECKWTDILPGGIGTTYDVSGTVTDSLGRLYTAPHQTLTIGANDSPIVSILMEKNTIFAGETVDITARASDDDGIQTIEILHDNTVLKTCSGTFSCTFQSGPWMNKTTLDFVARTTDALGASATSTEERVSVK